MAGRSRTEAFGFTAEARGKRRISRRKANRCFLRVFLRVLSVSAVISCLASAQTLDQAEKLWKARDYNGANDVFKVLVDREPNNALYRVRWGRMYLEHFQPADAADLFEEALKIDPTNAGAMLGKALIAAEEYGGNAAALARKALDADPKLVEAQELLARLALEDDNRPKAAEEAKQALAIDPNSSAAKAVLASLDWLADKKETQWDPKDARGYELAAHFFILNRRYDEAIALYRKAVALDPNLYSALSQLGITLMRLGYAEEAYTDLATCYDNHFRDAATVNSLRLLDTEKDYVTFLTPETVLKVDKREADALHPYFEAEMKRDIADYQKKYNFHLPKPVEVQVYHNHEDFAVRTLGLPGLGALGVTFGYAIAIDSPSGRPPGEFHWASTLRHEMSHVFTLEMTNFHVPRWFTEGLAVHEETAASPEWGDRLGPEEISAISNHRLLPVAELDRGFVHPVSPVQVVVSYFQAGKICDYINQKFGWNTLLAMLKDFGQGEDTAEVIRKELKMAPADFDKEFLASVDTEYKKQVDNFGKWREGVKTVNELMRNKDYAAAIKTGTEVRDLYPDFVEAGNAYEALAKAYEGKGDKAGAMAELDRYVHIGGRNPDTLMQLAAMLSEAGKQTEAAAVLERLNYIYPMAPEMHQRLGELLLQQGKAADAVREFKVLLAEHPQDAAQAHYDLARAYKENHQVEPAKEESVAALEVAPGFRPAQKLLLELSEDDKGTTAVPVKK
ncbi:MAG TPA: tetratricopeptide repeat protein [Bryobacteraceae bacterium]|nr:tetratricopeptide repeat protein [Bryobacteraceae bacterium]